MTSRERQTICGDSGEMGERGWGDEMEFETRISSHMLFQVLILEPAMIPADDSVDIA